MKLVSRMGAALGVIVLAFALHLSATPLGTGFTYQGRLNSGGNPANGIYDLRYTIYDALSGGNVVGATVTSAGVGVTNGLFTVALDFGSVFNGSALWLEIAARTNGAASYTTLSPRQALKAAPYALMANTASNLLGVLPVAQLSGALPSTQFAGTYGAAVALTNSSNSFHGSFTGNGAGLTNLSLSAMDDGGTALYQGFLGSAGALDAAIEMPFSALTLVSSNSGAAPAFALTLDGAAFGTVASFSGHEAMSEPYSYVVQALGAPNQLDPNAQLGRQGRVSFTRNGRTTVFAGLVTGCSVSSYEGTNNLYSFRLEPPLAWLALTTDYRVYQDSSGPAIVAALYPGLTSYSLSQSLTDTYGLRPCTLQYAETALNFMSRLLEDDGIFYFFNVGGSPPTLTLGDSASAYLPGSVSAFSYYGDTATNIPNGAEFIRSFQKAAHESAKASIMDAYDFSRPTVDLKQTRSSTEGRGTNYSFGAPVLTASDMAARTLKRQERQAVERATMCGTANGPDLRPGYTFTLTDQTGAGLGNTYVVTAVSHAAFRRVTNGVARLFYGNQFQVIPATLPCRPALKTPKPLAQPCVATVTGPAGSEIYVDSRGRVKVQFQWDRYGANDATSSGWVRVASPWAGNQRGMLFLPRMGDEVLVGFVQGDPDQPYVSGSFFNAAKVPPYALPANQTVSTIKTTSSPGGGGANEIRFEDKKGEEALGLSAQKDLTISANNDTAFDTGHDLSLSVGNDATIGVGHNLNLSSAATLTLSASAGVVIGATSGADALSVNGTGRMNDYTLYLRGNNGDLAHGLSWFGAEKPFGTSGVDGPVLFGCGGGALGTVCGGQKTALVWNSGGFVGIGTSSPTNRLHVIGGATFASGNAGANQVVMWLPGSASWNFSSDRNLKENLAPVDGQAVLEKVSRLPLAEWSYKGYEQRHIGPMAQDFHALFPLQGNDKMLDGADLNGVALAAIQGLNTKLEAARAENAELKARLEKLERLLTTRLERNRADE